MNDSIIAKPGESLPSDDPTTWSLHSGYPMIKVAQRGSGTSSGATITINHNLGYNPAYLVMIEDLYNAGEFFRATGDVASGQGWVENTPLDYNNIYLHDIPSGQDYYYIIYYDPALN